MDAPDEVREAVPPYDSYEVRLTYDDYCRAPEGLRYELVEGDLRMVPSPNVSHQRISGHLEKALRDRVDRHGLGEVLDAPLDVVLSQHNVVQPDILYVSRHRLGIITKANIWGPPDLVVEILSPSTANWERTAKRAVYAKYGVQELWIVDPEARSIEVAARQGGADLVTRQVYPEGTTLESQVLPGFALAIDDVFRQV